ncbi:MAG TPA: hypothetical protein VFR02_08280, partial [bacterium]|nr:hypothetical protein [bacterium]
GNPPPNITSNDMLEGVVESDAQVHQSVIEEFLGSVSRSCRKELELMRDQGPEEILSRFLGGPGGKFYCQKFKKSVLRNLPDIWVMPGKSANQSRAQQRKDIELMLPIVLQQAGTPDQQKIIIQRAIETMMWGDEEGLVGTLEEQKNCVLDLIAELQDNAENPDFKINIMPWHDMKVWMNEIERVLLNKTEFDTWPEISKQRLIDLYEQVVQNLSKQMAPQGGPSQTPQLPENKPPVPGMPPLPGAPPIPGMGQPPGLPR